MKIHEYQAKQSLVDFGISVLHGFPAFTVEEAANAAQRLSSPVTVVKAQIHAGGRGKGGGVRLARSVDEVREYARNILGMQLVTHQTGPEGKTVKRLLIEEGADIKKELYVSVTIDRNQDCMVLIASGEGGMEIEEVVSRNPDLVVKTPVNVHDGLSDDDARNIARKIGVPEAAVPSAAKQFRALCRAFRKMDASLIEINPMIVTGDDRVIALDAKVDFDDNALFRHGEEQAYRDLDEEDPAEVKASEFGLSYISLYGNIGCLVNGAGLAMATMDTIKLFGGEPANFLDVGGGATTEKVTEAFKIMLENPNVRAILVNIFGGIMRCDVIAEGVIEACRLLELKVPLVVRMKGTNEDIGKKLIAESGLQITTADSMQEAAQTVIKAVGAAQ